MPGAPSDIWYEIVKLEYEAKEKSTRRLLSSDKFTMGEASHLDTKCPAIDGPAALYFFRNPSPRKSSLGSPVYVPIFYFRNRKNMVQLAERELRFRGDFFQDQNANASTENTSSEDPQEKKTRRNRFISESAYQKYGSKSSRCKFTEWLSVG